jgi:lycopene beta-cyclase
MIDNSSPNTLKHTIKYDFIFAGYGAAASLLLIELHRKKLLSKKKILIVDPEIKSKNDKTFCFWAKDEDLIVKNLKDLIKHSWTEVILENSEIKSLAPLKYNHIASIDLYNQVLTIEKLYNWDRVIAPVESILRDETGAFIKLLILARLYMKK